MPNLNRLITPPNSVAYIRPEYEIDYDYELLLHGHKDFHYCTTNKGEICVCYKGHTVIAYPFINSPYLTLRVNSEFKTYSDEEVSRKLMKACVDCPQLYYDSRCNLEKFLSFMVLIMRFDKIGDLYA